MKINNLLSLIAMMLVFPNSVYANDSKVTFQNPDEFRDIRSTDQSKNRSQKALLNKLSSYIEKLSKDLPDGYSVHIVFTDIDLAGSVDYNFYMSREIRVIRHQDTPKLEFEVQLLKNGQAVSKSNVELKDIAFMDKPVFLGLRSDTLRYEKRMLKEWFESDLTTMIQNWNKQQNNVMQDV